MLRRKQLPAALASVFFVLQILAQGLAEQADPIEERFKQVGDLIRHDHLAEAEKLLNDVNLRSNSSKGQIGDLTISSYLFVSTLLVTGYLKHDDFVSAEHVLQDRIEWAQQHYGEQSRQQGALLTVLAEVYRLQGQYDAAEPLYLHSIAIAKSFHMDNCLIGAENYKGLAETYLALRRAADATALLAPVINSCQIKAGLPALFNLYSVALDFEGNQEEAAKVAARVDHETPPAPIFNQESRDLLRARVLVSLGKTEDALALCKKWITAMEVPDGPESDRRLMQPLEDYVRILLRAGRKSEAAEANRQLNQIQKKYAVQF